MKKTKKFINKLICVVLVICFLMSTLSTLVYSASESDGGDSETSESAKATGVVFAKIDVRKGTKITKKHVEFREVKGSIPENAFTDIDDVIGKYTLMALNADEYLYADQLSNAKAEDDSDPANAKYINVADFVKPNSGRDVFNDLQTLIDDNPKKTLYFPDGEYLISRSLRTHANPAKAVSLLLGDGAIIKADSSWKNEGGCDSLLHFGVYDSYNETFNPNGYSDPLSDVVSVGSYFWVQGGIFDGNGLANGISLDGGRETLVKNVLIKNVHLGIRVNKGVNNKSSDMDIDDVTIICDGQSGSAGIEMLGYDNTASNARIYNADRGINVPIYTVDGVNISSGGNAFRNIRVISLGGAHSYGFYEEWHANFYYHCYAEGYSTGFRIYGPGNIVDSCTTKSCSTSVASRNGFQSVISAHRTIGGGGLPSGNGRTEGVLRK